MKEKTLDEFVKVFGDQFEDKELHPVSSKTRFKHSSEWNSLQSLVVITALDEAFGHVFSVEELREAETIEDLYHLMRKAQT